MPVSGPAASDATLATAALQAIGSSPIGRDAEALAAWLLAWHAHWPTGFRRCFGADETTMISWARSQTSSVGRYIKLRRIAVENLASIL